MPFDQRAWAIAVKRIVLSVDALSQQRIVELRQEIASLQRHNESYRLKERHTASEVNSNELRRLRLLAIQEELLRLNDHRQRIR
jgi:hypothetical protein